MPENRFSRSKLEFRGPETASELVPETPAGSALRRLFSRSSRTRRRRGAASAPEDAKCNHIQ
eukprot:8145506-Alexandrium_andersonii.AAC.1